MFSPHSYTGGVGKYEGEFLDKKGRHDDEKLLYRFYKRFPALKLTPEIFNFQQSNKTLGIRPTFVIQDYMDKYKKLVKKGYTDFKAFQIVEEELTQLLEK